MKNINLKKLSRNEFTRYIIILMASIVTIYLLISLYFVNHTFFRTSINGVDISLKAHDEIVGIIVSSIKDYKLQLIERDGETEEIISQDIGMGYNEKNKISKIFKIKNPLKWISSLIWEQKYYVDDLFFYSKEAMENKINELNCLNKDIIEPQNVSFKYSDGLYEVIKEIYGNKVHKVSLDRALERSILEGKTKLDLNENLCYENPKYTLSSDKTLKTKDILNKYISTKITYIFGSMSETLDKNIINQWLSVDEDLEVEINLKAIKKYMEDLSNKYDTVGKARKIRTSTGKIIEVRGGFYGWRINRAAEIIALYENIKRGEVISKEPEYIQKALFREPDDIGNTYVEINITRQHLWFYKHGKLIAQGPVVTGKPSKENATDTGIYMLNYKQKGTILTGENYASEVTYWMPFNGNIGIHDASWRHSFGGDIFKRNGSHGCVNASLYLAKKIFENIEEGTPIICYAE